MKGKERKGGRGGEGGKGAPVFVMRGEWMVRSVVSGMVLEYNRWASVVTSLTVGRGVDDGGDGGVRVRFQVRQVPALPPPARAH